MLLQAHVEYETAKRHYAHVDCPGHADYVKVSLVDIGFWQKSNDLLFSQTIIETWACSFIIRSQHN